jgi:hypothetical protein
MLVTRCWRVRLAIEGFDLNGSAVFRVGWCQIRRSSVSLLRCVVRRHRCQEHCQWPGGCEAMNYGFPTAGFLRLMDNGEHKEERGGCGAEAIGRIEEREDA